MLHCGPQETHDLVGLLLMIRINYHHQLIMNKRRIPCLDDYLDRTNLLLWPRFKVPAACSHASIWAGGSGGRTCASCRAQACNAALQRAAAAASRETMPPPMLVASAWIQSCSWYAL